MRISVKKLTKRIGLLKIPALVAVFGMSILFGTSILEDIHLAFLRYKMKDVVKITNSQGSGGSGWLTKGVSGRKVILTNGHVCRLQENGYVYVHYRKNIYLLKVITIYPNHDLCAIEAPETSSNGFSIAYTTTYGRRVFTLGHPLLEPRSVTAGELSGSVDVTIQVGINVQPEQCQGANYELIPGSSLGPIAILFGVQNVCIRHLTSEASTAVILPGNSGSPTVNIFGSVVGCAFAANEFGTRSYHVPLSEIKEFLGKL